MKQSLTIAVLLFFSATSIAQSKKYKSIALFNTQSAMPFGKLAGMFTENLHPGIEAGLGVNFSIKKKHDYFWELKASYFFHRFVQHGIPVYANIGYRYKFSGRFSASAEIGGGYMHSVPATAKLKLNENGEYASNKGMGRMQAIATVGIGTGYIINTRVAKPVRLFITYQQRVQMPFVKSYVPLLPYNSFMIGISKPISAKPGNHK